MWWLAAGCGSTPPGPAETHFKASLWDIEVSTDPTTHPVVVGGDWPAWRVDGHPSRTEIVVVATMPAERGARLLDDLDGDGHREVLGLSFLHSAIYDGAALGVLSVEDALVDLGVDLGDGASCALGDPSPALCTAAGVWPDVLSGGPPALTFVVPGPPTDAHVAALDADGDGVAELFLAPDPLACDEVTGGCVWSEATIHVLDPTRTGDLRVDVDAEASWNVGNTYPNTLPMDVDAGDDLDGDGTPDLLVSQPYNDKHFVLTTPATGGVLTEVSIVIFGEHGLYRVGDVDGDDVPDLGFVSKGDRVPDGLEVVFGPIRPGAYRLDDADLLWELHEHGQVFGVADLDGDGEPDVVHDHCFGCVDDVWVRWSPVDWILP